MRIIAVLLFLFMVLACQQVPDYPNEPQIEFISISKTNLQQGSLFEDSTFVRFSFTDGDGDLGDQDVINIFVKDLRDTSENFTGYRLPKVPEEGAGNGLSGEIELLLYTTCCIYTNGQIPCEPSTTQPLDTVHFEIFIEDRAGNKSNRIPIPPITLRCD